MIIDIHGHYTTAPEDAPAGSPEPMYIIDVDVAGNQQISAAEIALAQALRHCSDR
jgi:hypothetical protein